MQAIRVTDTTVLNVPVTAVTGKPTEVEILPEQWSPEMMPDPGLLGRW